MISLGEVAVRDIETGLRMCSRESLVCCRRRARALLILGVAVSPIAVAQRASAANISLSNAAYAQDFSTLAASGTSSILPTGWFFSEAGSSANTTYTAGTGSSQTGDTYSFGASNVGERAFGGLRSGTLIPTVGGAFDNSSGATITSFSISYFGEQWRLGAVLRLDRLDFQYSLDATSLSTGTWNDQNALDFSTPNPNDTVGVNNGNSASNRTALSGTISGLLLNSGSSFWIRWSDVDVSGADDGLGVDDFNLTFTTAEKIWNTTTGAWSTTATNWRNGSTGNVAFVNGDPVIFPSNSNSTVTVDAAGVTPASIKVTNTANKYTIAGGAIGGSGGITKTGAGELQLDGANTYDGVTNIQAGTVKLGNANTLGSTAGGTTVASGAVLDLNGQAVGAEPLSLAGVGASNAGALINSSTITPASFAGPVTLTANATIGGAGNITLSNAISGGFALSKLGSGNLTLTGNNNYSGATSISQGMVFVNGGHSGGDSYSVGGTGTVGGNSTVTLAPGATVTIGDGAGGSVAPGSAGGVIGNFTLATSGAGATVFAGGGSFVWDSNSGSDNSQSDEATTHGTPGANWDLLTLNKLSIAAAGGSDTFKVVISSAQIAGFLASHDKNKPGKWKLATFTSIENFDISKFFVDATAVPVEQRLGDFYVSVDTAPDGSGELDLRYAPEPSIPGLFAILGASAALRRRRRGNLS